MNYLSCRLHTSLLWYTRCWSQVLSPLCAWLTTQLKHVTVIATEDALCLLQASRKE